MSKDGKNLTFAFNKRMANGGADGFCHGCGGRLSVHLGVVAGWLLVWVWSVFSLLALRLRADRFHCQLSAFVAPCIRRIGPFPIGIIADALSCFLELAGLFNQAANDHGLLHTIEP